MDRRTFLISMNGISPETGEAQYAEASSKAGDVGRYSRNREKITSTLSPWIPSALHPWDVASISHLYRRAGFGTNIWEVKAAKSKLPSQVIDSLLDDALLAGNKLPPDPTYADQWLQIPPYVYTDFKKRMDDYNHATMKIRSRWTVVMSEPEVMLREKMALFWMNHFVIESKKVRYPQPTYKYLQYMRQNAWGNFKQMVKDVTISPAMLFYLDGILNVGTSPNENYARELQELFTMGVLDHHGNPNYSQLDVEAIAHSLTGWTIDLGAPPPDVIPAAYVSNMHDSAQQKIYDGVARVYNLAASNVSMDKDVIDHIFEQRADQISWFICTKLYQLFVYHEITTDAQKAIVDELATTFKQNWNIKEVLSLLLKSEHFFDSGNIGVGIKSQFEYMIGICRTFKIPLDELSAGSLYYYGAECSQILLDPPNVKGWPGYHNWISATSLPYRNDLIATQLLIGQHMPALGMDGYGNANTTIDLWDYMVTSWGKQFASYAGTFDDLLGEMISYLCAQPPSLKAVAYVKSKFTPNFYEWPSLSDADKIAGLRLMAKEIMLLADYQLN